MQWVDNMDQDQKAIYLDYIFQKEIVTKLYLISSVIAITKPILLVVIILGIFYIL